MQESPHTGHVWIEVAGQPVALRFDWAAISRLRGEFGEGFELQVEEAFAGVDVDAISRILSAGSDKPPRWWMEASPPIVPTALAARRALTHAFMGGGFEEDPDPSVPGLLATLLGLATRITSGGLSKSGSAPAGPQKPSGG